MSCETLSSSFVSLNVTMGALPEGFCPASMQDLANSIAARLIVTPNQSFSTFAIGSLEPSSNIGPWLKDCTEWFVFDDATGRYIPTLKGGFDNLEYHSTNGVFIVPAFIYKLKVKLWGGGGGGSGTFGGGTPGSGGGGGGFGQSVITVTPGQIINYTVGTGGGGGGAGAAGGDGGASVFLGMTSNGGKGAPGTVHLSAAGGTATGATINMFGTPGQAGGSNTGLGGSSPQGGGGGTNDQAGAGVNINGLAPGGGGGGGETAPGRPAAGNGALGGVQIEW